MKTYVVTFKWSSRAPERVSANSLREAEDKALQRWGLWQISSVREQGSESVNVDVD